MVEAYGHGALALAQDPALKVLAARVEVGGETVFSTPRTRAPCWIPWPPIPTAHVASARQPGGPVPQAHRAARYGRMAE